MAWRSGIKVAEKKEFSFMKGRRQAGDMFETGMRSRYTDIWTNGLYGRVYCTE